MDKQSFLSIEKLAAFMDGNLTQDEMSQISQMADDNFELHQMLDANDVIDNLITSYNEQDLQLPDEIIGADFRIPDIENADFFSSGGDSFEEEWNLYGQEVLDNQQKKQMEQSKTYGYETNHEINRFDPYDIDPNIWQGLDNTCAIRSQEIILRDYGIIIPKDELVKYATEQGWFDPAPDNGGTPQGYIGNLIDACGIKTVRTENATIYDIIAELRAGHRVMVSLDADELWVKNEPNIFNRLYGEAVNRVNDAIQNMRGVEGANHALVVAGVNVNPHNPSDVKVVLIDSGDGKVCIEYSLKDFQNAWADGHCQMVSTTIPAPYQYNYHTHQMEPSGFDTDFIPSMVELPEGLNNGFVLADSYYSDYCNYSPTYDSSGRVIGLDNSAEESSQIIGRFISDESSYSSKECEHDDRNDYGDESNSNDENDEDEMLDGQEDISFDVEDEIQNSDVDYNDNDDDY